MKGGYRMKPENLRGWEIHLRHLSDVSVSRCKTVSKLYENSYVSNCVQKLYNRHIPQIQNQSENHDIRQEPENLRFAPVIII